MKFLKKYLLLFAFAYLAAGCSGSNDKKLENLIDSASRQFKNGINSDIIESIEQNFTKDFRSREEISPEELKRFYSGINKSFIISGYQKKLVPNTQPVTGNGAEYYKLRTSNLKLTIEGADKAMLTASFALECNRKIRDTSEIEIFAALRLYNDSSVQFREYVLYLIPDFYETIKKGKGKFNFQASLDAVWDASLSNPFRASVELFRMLDKATKYELMIEVKNRTSKKNEEEQNKEYQELLDDIKIN